MKRISIMLAFIVLFQGTFKAQEKGRKTQEITKFYSSKLINEIENKSGLLPKGEFSKTIKLIESKLENKTKLLPNEVKILERYLSSIKGVKREYNLTYGDVYKELKAQIPDLSDSDITRWETDNSLEHYLIDGEKKYYYYCISDLFKVNKEAAKRAKIENNKNKDYDYAKEPLETITALEKGIELTKKINVAFTFTVPLGSLPNNSIIKAWIPYMRENKYQSNVQILHSSSKNFTLPEKNLLTSMIYFEKEIDLKNNSNKEWKKYFEKPAQDWVKPMKNISSINDSLFMSQFIYEYDSKAYYKKVKLEEIKPYNTSSREYKKFTEETENNLFTPYLVNLSKKIIGKETNYYIIARKIFQWVCENITWVDSKPVIGDYAEYTAKYKRGDCSAKANLFISLCRINKIPARIQGGWHVAPNRSHVQHSWAQVYFEPFGWLPVDTDAGTHLINNENEEIRYFYFCNRTPYSLIIYDDDEPLSPAKKFECIYGGGTQLGAFEWKNGDLEAGVKIDSQVK